MKDLPDISAYFIGQRAVDEEISWLMNGSYKKKTAIVNAGIEKYGIKSIVEWGCRSGLIAAGLPKAIPYLGMDTNEDWLEMAKERNRNCSTRKFMLTDIRKNIADPEPDWLNYSLARGVVIAFDFMKHMPLGEWDAILKRVLSCGRYCCFSAQVCGNDFDDGTRFHHVFVSKQHLAEAIQRAGYEELSRQTLSEWRLPSGDMASDIEVWTIIRSSEEERT